MAGKQNNKAAVKVWASFSDRTTAMTSGINSQSDSLESHGNSVNNNNSTNTLAITTGAGAAGIELIVSIDGASDGEKSPHALPRGQRNPRSKQAGQRRGSLPDVMRLLPPIKDRNLDSALHQGKTSGAGSVGRQSNRSSSPLLVHDRGGPGLCFGAVLESEKMLPVLMNADGGLASTTGGLATHRSQAKLSRSSLSLNHGGSSLMTGSSLSPRPPSPSLLHHNSKDKPIKSTTIPIPLRRFSEDKQAVSLDSTLLRRTLSPDSPLSDITDVHPLLLRRRSCQRQQTKRITFPRRASEGVLPMPPSQLGHFSATKTKLDPRGQQTLPYNGREEVGELIAPGPKSTGKQVSNSLGFSRISRLNSASLEAVNVHEDEHDSDEQERQRILNWLEGVKKGLTNAMNEDLRVSELIPLRTGDSETAIRVIHDD